MKRRILSFLILFASLTLTAGSTTFYVSPSGNDASSGDIHNPVKTLNHATSLLSPGDTLYLRAGRYSETLALENFGTQGKLTLIAPYPGETATIDGQTVSLPEWSGLVDLENCRSVRLSGLRVTNAGPHGNNPGIQVEGCADVEIIANHTVNTASSGILVWNSSNILVEGNEVEGACSLGASSINECISVGETDSFIISGNHVHHGSTVRGEGIVPKDGSSNGLIYGNHVHDVDDVGIYIDAWDKHTHDLHVFRNRVHDIRGDGIAIGSEMGGLLENIRVENNLSYNNLYIGISVHKCCVNLHPVRGVLIVNNTVYGNGLAEWGGGIGHENGQAENVIIRNNICAGNLTFQIAREDSVGENAVIDHNLIDEFQNSEGEVRGAAYVEGDPMFTDPSAGDFSLLQGSPAIDAGTSLQAPAEDFRGTPRPYGITWDIGAFEFTGPTAVRESPGILPEELRLPVYPNPFRKSCFISAPPESRITVYDMAGTVVANGRSPMRWTPGSTLSGGVYLIRAETDRKTLYRPVLYIK